MAGPKICEFFNLSETQRKKIHDMVDRDRLALESLESEYAEGIRLYDSYLENYPNITIFIPDLTRSISQSRQEIEEIHLNQFLYVFSNILDEKQRSLIPTCTKKLKQLIR